MTSSEFDNRGVDGPPEDHDWSHSFAEKWNCENTVTSESEQGQRWLQNTG